MSTEPSQALCGLTGGPQTYKSCRKNATFKNKCKFIRENKIFQKLQNFSGIIRFFDKVIGNKEYYLTLRLVAVVFFCRRLLAVGFFCNTIWRRRLLVVF